MVLCAYDGFVYKQQEFRIDPGDSILLYTDGVTEAKDTERKNYGENRLLELMSRTDTDEDTGADVKDDCRIICERVFKDVAAYAEGEPQSDDITVLCVTYAGNNIS
jgi:sigma-B regulation protein RsbU (phosphoserine phosphatase)